MNNHSPRPHSLKWLALAAYLVCGALVVTFTTPLLGWRALDVLTPSMKPHIAPGALVLVHRVPVQSIRPGQIVTYEDPHHRGVTVTHRVVSTGRQHGAPTITTKGDANQTADAPVPAGSVVGRVEAVVPGLGRALSLFHSPAVLILLVIIPGLVVIAGEARRLRQILAQRPALDPQPAHTVRRLDGVYYRVTGLALVAGLVALATGSTLAQLTSTVSLTGNNFVATSTTSPTPVTPSPTVTASPTASPCADVSIHDTGPGSTNVVQCTSTFSSSSSSSTDISITNDVSQSTRTGDVTIDHNTSSSSSTPGSTSNHSSSSFDINVTGP